jgi:hypothetical protein
MNDIPLWRKALLIIAAPFIIGAWCIMHPRKVWEEAVASWNTPSACTGDCNQGRNCTCQDTKRSK